MRDKEKPAQGGPFKKSKNISHPTSGHPRLQVEISVSDFRPYERNTLKGFCDLSFLKIGLLVKGCGLHERDGKRWLSFTGRPYQGQDGKQQWQSILSIDDKELWSEFQRAALQAVDKLPREGEK